MMRIVRALLLAAATLSAREVAITIDDLPRGGDGIREFEATRQMTTKLLEPFRLGKIPVTGFVNECRRPEELPELLAIWRAAGADLGNHTCSHPDPNSVPVADYLADIDKGEAITTKVLGRRPRYFRHPFLHTGPDAAAKQAIDEHLQKRGYIAAPVTMDNSDYMFAAVYTAAPRPEEAKRIRAAYLAHMEAVFDFFEKRSVEVAGHEIRQILLIHANQLNADALPELLEMLKRREYRIVTLDRAMEDEAYRLPDNYVGPSGFSWIHRWSRTKGMAPKAEPDEPAWILEAYNKRQAP
ncbi:MAG TPA: polysaccharide deacetylase family protein [Bryobacteraceae bacterium]|nr:polysaccharide deacetylase family protein [Bryobacteraceae bacterium]